MVNAPPPSLLAALLIAVPNSSTRPLAQPKAPLELVYRTRLATQLAYPDDRGTANSRYRGRQSLDGPLLRSPSDMVPLSYCGLGLYPTSQYLHSVCRYCRDGSVNHW